MKRLISLLALGFAAPVAAQAASPVTLQSNVMVERTATDAEGRTQVRLEEPRVVIPGDKLVFVLNYRNGSGAPATDFVVTNPLPAAVAYQEAGDARAEVSVDGGRNWGQIQALRVHDADGSVRPARADEVTHIRWAFAQPIPAGEAGRLMFRGVVR